MLKSILASSISVLTSNIISNLEYLRTQCAVRGNGVAGIWAECGEKKLHRALGCVD